MVQPHEHLTYQLYQAYHKHVHSTRDVQTYMHFGAVTRTNAASQTELLTGYMKAMIESIITDMNRFGCCWLLEAILGHELPSIHVLDYSAVIYVHTSVFEPEEKPRLNTRSIPYTGEFSGSAGGLLYADARALSCTVDIREERLIHHKCRALLLHAVQRTMQARIDAAATEKNALNSQIAELKDRIFGLERELTAAHKALEDSASAAIDAEKARLLEEARADAAAQRENAAALQAVAERAHASLETELAARRHQHEESLAAQEAAMRERLTGELAQQAIASREALRQEFTHQGDAAACRDVRSAVSEAAASLQQRMSQQLEAFTGNLERLQAEMLARLSQAVAASAEAADCAKTDMTQELQIWQARLLQQDTNRLISIWAELYRYSSSPLAEEAARLLVHLDPETDADVIAFINEVQSHIGSLLIQLEAAIRDLGMEFFTPTIGTPYDDVRHSVLNVSELPSALYGSVITACHMPGIRMAANAQDTEENRQIIRRAEVLAAPGLQPVAREDA